MSWSSPEQKCCSWQGKLYLNHWYIKKNAIPRVSNFSIKHIIVGCEYIATEQTKFIETSVTFVLKL